MALNFCVQKLEETGVSFSYSGFNGFRHRVARSIGLKNVYANSDNDMYISGRYKEIEYTHPMYPLIDHADNDGKLEPDDCGQVGAYLKTLIQEWKRELDTILETDENGDSDLENDISEGEKLADVMIECHQNNDVLMFM
jgi:hypothetical protein